MPTPLWIQTSCTHQRSTLTRLAGGWSPPSSVSVPCPQERHQSSALITQACEQHLLYLGWALSVRLSLSGQEAADSWPDPGGALCLEGGDRSRRAPTHAKCVAFPASPLASIILDRSDLEGLPPDDSLGRSPTRWKPTLKASSSFTLTHHDRTYHESTLSPRTALQASAPCGPYTP